MDGKNKAIWRAANVAKSKGSMDVPAIRIELEASGELDYVGGIGALVSLIDDSSNVYMREATVHADSTGYFAKKVKEERRRLDVAKTVDTLNQCVIE